MDQRIASSILMRGSSQINEWFEPKRDPDDPDEPHSILDRDLLRLCWTASWTENMAEAYESHLPVTLLLLHIRVCMYSGARHEPSPPPLVAYLGHVNDLSHIVILSIVIFVIFVILSYCHIVILPYCHIVILPYRHIAISPYHHIAWRVTVTHYLLILMRRPRSRPSFARSLYLGKLGASGTLFCHKPRAWCLDHLQSSAAYVRSMYISCSIISRLLYYVCTYYGVLFIRDSIATRGPLGKHSFMPPRGRLP